MQEAFTVTINGPGCVEKKKEIDRTAEANHMSRSEFMLWLYERFAIRKRKKSYANQPYPKEGAWHRQRSK